MNCKEQTDSYDYDLLVIGAGMAGLTAGGRAAEAGARVLVLEKAPEFGGNGQHAAFIWSVSDTRVIRGWDDGEPHLAQVVVDHFAEGVEWLRRRDVLQSGPTRVLHGRGYAINAPDHMNKCAKTIKGAGGHVAYGVQVQELIVSPDGKVEGARFLEQGELMEIRSTWTLLATGGYQADPELRVERIHPNARSIALRSNPYSNGGGIRLGLLAGGSWAGKNSGFYGHLVSSPTSLSWDQPSNFANLSQYHSDFSLLFNEGGSRFTDESQGDFRSSEMLVFEPHARGLLVWDEYVQREHIMKPFVLGVDVFCKLELALKYGALGTKAAALEGLEDAVKPWGFDGEAVVRNIADYNRKVQECPEQLQPPRVYDWRPLSEPPYYALVVEPAITFSQDGLWVDDQARALNKHGKPIPGLLVAGADAGNVFKNGYYGGLGFAMTFALRAVRTAGWN